MKIKFTLTLFTLLATTLLLLNNAAGPGNVQGLDRTGSPLSPGSCSAPGCHSGGGFNPSVSIELLKNNQAVSQYQPGETYDMKVTIAASSGTPGGYGFQAVALSSTGDANAGSWGTPPPGMQSLTLSNNRSYVEHSFPNTTNNFFQVEWTAPQTGTGEVTIYAAGNAVNTNSNSTGDAAMVSQKVIQEEIENSTFEQGILSNFAIFPNPVQEDLNFKISSRNSETFELKVIDINGKIVQAQQLELNEGQNERSINVGNLDKGLYLIQLIHGQDIAIQTILKM